MKAAGLRPGQVAGAVAAGLSAPEVLTALDCAADQQAAIYEVIRQARQAGRKGETWSARRLPEQAKRPGEDPGTSAFRSADWFRGRHVAQRTPVAAMVPPGELVPSCATPEGRPNRTGCDRGRRRHRSRAGHRAPIPEDNEDDENTNAELVITRTAGQWNAALCVTVAVPAAPLAALTPPVSVHAGWRQWQDGSARVATWASSEPPRVRSRCARWQSGGTAAGAERSSSPRLGSGLRT
jgi:hypothetical protein